MAANNTMDESIALITAANTVVQDPTVVGTAFKTISMRIRGAKTELEEAGLETEGMVESTATLRSEILALSGVDIMENANEFKSTYKIMDELARKWGDLSDIQQATVTELIAGKRQGNIVSSLMTNFDTAREALDTSMNSAGSAMAEHEKWMQSVEAGINKVKAAWQSLSQSFLKSDFLRGLLGTASNLLDVFSKLTDTFGALPTLATLFMGGRSLFNKGGFLKVTRDELTGFATGITTTFGQVAKSVNASLSSINVNNGFSAFLDKDDIQSLINYQGQLQAGVNKTQAWSACMVNASEAAQNTARSTEFLTGGLNGYIKSQQSAEISTLAQNKSLGSARALMKEYQSGCKTTGMAQQDFANAVKQTNPQLADAMTSTNNVKDGMAKYTKSLVAAKIGTFALQAAQIALNTALTMGISLLVSGLISGIQNLINAKKELAEQVDELTSKFKEQSEELKKLQGDYDTSNESSMISKYAKLSKGVDNLGRNVSLTADEYSEYQGIVNKIAEQIPSLVSGYDSEGNALLSVKGNIEELTKAYEKLIHMQNQEILTKNSDDIEKNWKNQLSKAKDYGFWETIGNSMSLGALFGSDNLKVWDMKLDTAELLEDFVNSEGKRKNILQNMQAERGQSNYSVNASDSRYLEIIQALQNAGVDVDAHSNLSDVLKDVWEKEPEKIKNIIDNYYVQFDDIVAEYKTKATALLSEAFDIGSEISGLDYNNISEEMQAIAYQVVNGVDFKFLNKLTENGITIEEWVKNMLNQFNSIGKADSVILETAFNLKTQFNDGEVTYGEYAEGIQEAKDIIDGLELDDETKNTIKLSLDDSEIQTQYNHIFGYLRDNFYLNKDTRDMDRDEEYDYKFKARENDKKVKEFLNSLTSDELAAVIDIKTEIDWESADIEKIRKQIEDRVKLNEALSFETDIAVDTTALEALNTVLEESASAMGLSEESIDSLKAKYSDLEGYNPHTLFEKTANGVKVNREELAKLEKKYNDLTKTEVQEHLDTLVDEYNKCTKAIDGNIGSQEKLELISKREKYAKQIEELAEYQAQLEGVTGAYQRWLDAQNTPEDYEGYEKVATSREDIEDEVSRGFISNATKEYIDLLSGKDLVGGTIDDYYNAWKKLDEKVGSTSYSIKDFFTVNDDGDITSTGIDRFFKGIQQDFEGEVYKFNKDTGEYYYDFSKKNLEAIQDEWGIGIEAIELLLEAAESAGYNVDWGGMFDDLDLDTSNFESVEAMISLAEKAQEEFNKLDGIEDVEFNFRTNNIQDATTEVEKARKAYVDLITNDDGSLNLKAEGAEQMQFMLATLLTQKQQLSTPAIMKVDTSQIDKAETDIIDVINKAKTLQTAYENYEIAITTGVDVEGAKADLNSAIDGMKGTSVDVRADLKLPTNEELTSAANGLGSIKVGASLDDTSIGNIATKIQTECTPNVIAKVTGLDQSAIEGTSQQVVYTAEHSDVDNFIDSLSDIPKKIIYTYETQGLKPNPNNIERTITYKYETEGDVPEAYGTANANGTTGRAFARGNWGIKGSGIALGGELGQELVVRDGKFFTIGDSGAQFFHYKPNDIIFNAAQTESLFKYGGIKGAKPRGTMYASGSAFATGNYPSSGDAFFWATASKSKFASYSPTKVSDAKVETKTQTKDNSVETNTKINFAGATVGTTEFSKQNSESSEEKLKTKEEVKEFEETFDWISIAIDRIEREIDNLDKKVNNTYKSWGDRNKALNDEIAKVGEEIKLQSDAAYEYLNKAEEFLSHDSDYATKIREGTLDIDTLNQDNSSEELVENIKNYQKWYELYLQCIDAANELRQTEAELAVQRFENIQSQYDGILQGFDHTETMLNEYISQAEAKGHIVSKQYYDALIKNENARISELKGEQKALVDERDKLVEEGKIDKYSEEW